MAIARQFYDFFIFSSLRITVDKLGNTGIFTTLGIKIEVNVSGPLGAQVNGVIETIVARILRRAVIHDVSTLQEAVHDAVGQEDVADTAVRRVRRQGTHEAVFAVKSPPQFDRVTGQILKLTDEGRRIFFNRQDHGRQNHRFRKADVDDARKELIRMDDDFIKPLADQGVIMRLHGNLIDRHIAFIIQGRQFFSDLIVVGTGPRILIALKEGVNGIVMGIIEHGYDFAVRLLLIDMIKIETYITADHIPIEDAVLFGIFRAVR